MGDDDDVPASQASSHFELEPISAAVLCRRETKRRDALAKRGPVKVGCPEVDDYVLVGGLERGSVVGLSAESEQMGLLVCFLVFTCERNSFWADVCGRFLRKRWRMNCAVTGLRGP